ncbi:MAG: chemotaxis protein CheW, partial [Planctomycetota bacterium]
IRDKAIEKELITAEQAETMSQRELISLILLPGFSTAEKVTNVSGRGVGMDVVKTNIERIGGTLDICSTAGQGTTLRIKIPLTLAIVPALIVQTDGQQYAIPQVSLLELVRLDRERAQREIEFIQDVPVYRLRGNLLPLVYLDEQLGLRKTRLRHDERDGVNIVVLQAEDRQFGLVVDAITDTQEIVVKPLGPHLKGISAYAGATIMGDGNVSLILDVIGVARDSNVLTQHHDRSLRNHAASETSTTQAMRSMLLVDSPDGTRAAIQLSAIARLEEFSPSSIEQSGQNQVVQYRGEILPLIHLSGGGTGGYAGGYAGGYSGGYSGDPASDGSSQDPTLHTVVYHQAGQPVGVVVGKVIDIVNVRDDETVRDANGRCVIQDRVTEIVDLGQVVQVAMPSWPAPA